MMPFYRSGGTDGIGDYPESMPENPLGGGDLRERPSLPFQNSLLVQGERTTEQIGIVEEKPRHAERRVNPADLLSRTLGKAQQAGVMPGLSRLLPRRWEKSPHAGGARLAHPACPAPEHSAVAGKPGTDGFPSRNTPRLPTRGAARCPSRPRRTVLPVPVAIRSSSSYAAHCPAPCNGAELFHLLRSTRKAPCGITRT